MGGLISGVSAHEYLTIRYLTLILNCNHNLIVTSTVKTSQNGNIHTTVG